MADFKQTTENTDSINPERADRELVLRDWGEQKIRETASELGIELSEEHWEVINTLRDYYLEQGPAENGRVLGDLLEERFAARGGRRHLRRLFPEGPVGQGLRIAGLPVPPHTEDEGFGTSR